MTKVNGKLQFIALVALGAFCTSEAHAQFGGFKPPKPPKVELRPQGVLRPGPYQREKLEAINKHGGQGATAGGFVGGAVGSAVVPGPGTAVGAAVGGTAGYVVGGGYGAWYDEHQRDQRVRDYRTSPIPIWRYANGAFVPSGNGQWVEQVGGRTSFYFKEVGRTASYIDLYDASRSLTVRLLGDQCRLKQGNGNWTLLYFRA